MPQIKITTGILDVIKAFDGEDIGNVLIGAVEQLWPCVVKDVTFTLMKAEKTINECDIQVLFNYTPGYRYQNEGKFNPDNGEKEEMTNVLGNILKRYFPENDVVVTVFPFNDAITKVFDY